MFRIFLVVVAIGGLCGCAREPEWGPPETALSGERSVCGMAAMYQMKGRYIADCMVNARRKYLAAIGVHRDELFTPYERRMHQLGDDTDADRLPLNQAVQQMVAADLSLSKQIGTADREKAAAQAAAKKAVDDLRGSLKAIERPAPRTDL